MEIFLSQIFKEEISLILNYLTVNTNLLITSTDEYIIDAVIGSIKAHYNNMDWTVEDVETKKSIEDNTLVIIKIDGSTALASSTLLYYYLELANSKTCKVIFITQNSSAIDNMEKRVKSRFSNHVCVLRSLTVEEYLALYKYLVFTESSLPSLAENNKSDSVSESKVDDTTSKESSESLSDQNKSTEETSSGVDLDSVTNNTGSEDKENDMKYSDSDLINIILCNSEEIKPAPRRFERRKAAMEVPEVKMKGKRKMIVDKVNPVSNNLLKGNSAKFTEDNSSKFTEKVKKLLNGVQFDETDFSRKMITEEKLAKVENYYDLHRDTLQLANLYARFKYDFKEYKLESLLEILDNIHLAILFMCSVEKITFNNVSIEYTKFVSGCKELKKCSKDEIFRAFCEIAEYNLINEKGNLLINETYLRKFINSGKRPHFMKSLLNKLKN